MNPKFASFCRLFAAIVLVLSARLATAHDNHSALAITPVMAQFQMRPSDLDRKDPPAQQMASAYTINAIGYAVTVIIPITLFIVMIGFVRRNDA